MNYDSFLEVGSQHKVCEDFIVSGTILQVFSTPCPYVILSDGCSASENANYGAMILVQFAKRYLDHRRHELAEIDYHDMGGWIICNAEAVVRSMGLNQACLDATLIVSYLRDGIVYVYIYGDGCVVTKSLIGLSYYEISFPSDSPYYLSYKTDYFRREAYKNSGHLKVVKHVVLNGKFVVLHEKDLQPDFPSHYKFDTADFKEIYVASDGINSFIRNGVKLSVKDVMKSFLDMKRENRGRSTKGVFIQRRCRRTIKGFRKEGWDHYDDISFGGFLCDTT